MYKNTVDNYRKHIETCKKHLETYGTTMKLYKILRTKFGIPKTSKQQQYKTQHTHKQYSKQQAIDQQLSRN